MEKPDLKDISSTDPKVKYTCAGNLKALARENPAELYPNLGLFADLIDGSNNILKWTAIIIIGELARVDSAGAVDKLLGKLYGLLDGGVMITANNTIGALGNIALAKPEHREDITRELLKVERYSYATEECRNIAIGKVIVALAPYFSELREKEAPLAFVRRQTGNTRNSTRKKAEQFLRKFDRRN